MRGDAVGGPALGAAGAARESASRGPRMTSRLLNLLTVLSLLLCVAVCVLSARSYWVQYVLVWEVPDARDSARGRVFRLTTCLGEIGLTRFEGPIGFITAEPQWQ